MKQDPGLPEADFVARTPAEPLLAASTEAGIAASIGRQCRDLAEMARDAQFHSLAELLLRAEIEAELWARASEDR